MIAAVLTKQSYTKIDMSEFNKYTLSPGAVASMTEPTPDLQRNYRQRGMLDNYGELQDNGRWKYSVSDLVAI